MSCTRGAALLNQIENCDLRHDYHGTLAHEQHSNLMLCWVCLCHTQGTWQGSGISLTGIKLLPFVDFSHSHYTLGHKQTYDIAQNLTTQQFKKTAKLRSDV